MTGPDLKPCPFCGGNNVRAFRHVPMQPDPCVMRRDCYASAVSVAEWNRRDPAVLAALPEVQALIAAASAETLTLVLAIVTDIASTLLSMGDDAGANALCVLIKTLEQHNGAIPKSVSEALTPAEAAAALARIEREAEARGRVKGLREAAEAAEGAWGDGPTGHYDNGGTRDGWDLACSHVSSAILARAAKIEADALTEVYYQREMASDEPQGPNDLSISGSTPSVAVCGICDIADCHHIRARKESGA